MNSLGFVCCVKFETRKFTAPLCSTSMQHLFYTYCLNINTCQTLEPSQHVNKIFNYKINIVHFPRISYDYDIFFFILQKRLMRSLKKIHIKKGKSSDMHCIWLLTQTFALTELQFKSYQGVRDQVCLRNCVIDCSFSRANPLRLIRFVTSCNAAATGFQFSLSFLKKKLLFAHSNCFSELHKPSKIAPLTKAE